MALKKKPPGDVRTIRTPRNIQAVRQSVQTSPTRSAAKHAIAIGISDRSVRRILHFDLKFHPYKMVVTQELSHRDWESRRICAENMNAIQENFPGHVMRWPARSHDLSACDYFLWGYLNGKVYVNKPSNSEELKAAIRREIAAISESMLQRVMLDFNERLRKYLQAGGRHLDEIIFKT
ncbi:hypothetical protein C0J52_25939 [Blattella germanica]|nr:hypothetical protein C0J52_25939 [Blattella germanica]